LIDFAIGKENTLYMVLRLRAGMYDYSSGRNGFNKLSNSSLATTIKIKYVPGDNEMLEIDVDSDET